MTASGDARAGWEGRLPRLHLVTDDRVLAGDFLQRAGPLIEMGGTAVALHIRGPRTPGRRLYHLTAGLRGVCADHGALLLVNDRADISAAARADGVHLGERSVEPACARRVLGDSGLIGRSMHRARPDFDTTEVDYLVVGNVFETESHPGRAAAGTNLIRGCRETRIPVIAIGGVTPARVHRVRAAGAYGIAVLGGIWRSGDPGHALRAYMSALEESDG